MPFTFDNTITMGQILTAFGFLVGGLGAFFALKGRLLVIETLAKGQTRTTDGIQEEIKELRKLVTEQARFDVELATMKREMYDLKTGRGWITDPPSAVRGHK